MSVEYFQQLVTESFNKIESQLNGSATGPLHAVRRKALEAFQRQGVPTTRHEEWKYTNVLPSLVADYSLSLQNTPEVKGSIDVNPRLSLDAYQLHILNGQLQIEESTLPEDGSIEVHLLTDTFVIAHPEAQDWLATLSSVNTHPFVAANTAMMDAGVVVRISAGAVLTKPLHISIVSDARNGNVVSTPRIVVVVGGQAECTIIEEYNTVGENASLMSTVTQLIAGRNSKPTYVKLIDESALASHIGHTSAVVHANASLTCVTLCLGGKLTRNELEVRLIESAAEVLLYGVSVLTDNELADNHTLVDHVAPHCHSEEEYKGVYDGRSTGVFNGKIMVRPDAQKTTAYQSSRTVLLSASAQVNTKPQLEIFADDVKCSHGATCGQIDDEAVFYLQSRGISYEDARALIVYAFAAEIVDHVPNDALRSLVDRRIAEKLGAHPFDIDL